MPHSTTPPPVCDRPSHEICVLPAWGEKIPGSQVMCRCVLCHEDDLHHAIRCIRCHNAPGCYRCIRNYMRSRYNSGCPLCCAGDPKGENPLGQDQYRRRCVPRTREEVTYYGRGRRGTRRGLLCGIGRSRGRGRAQPQEQEQQQRQQPPVGQLARRGRRGRGRAVTIEEEEKKE